MKKSLGFFSLFAIPSNPLLYKSKWPPCHTKHFVSDSSCFSQLQTWYTTCNCVTHWAGVFVVVVLVFGRCIWRQTFVRGIVVAQVMNGGAWCLNGRLSAHELTPVNEWLIAGLSYFGLLPLLLLLLAPQINVCNLFCKIWSLTNLFPLICFCCCCCFCCLVEIG